ncbi:hypothetical protein Tco_1515917 [Tanacetum coccineum]
MAAPVISISSDSSDESVGSSIPRVILIGSIPIEVPVAPEVGAAVVTSLTGVLELDTHSSSESDPSESSLPLVLVAPMVSPFICSDDLKSYIEMPERHVSSTPHDVMVARLESRVDLGIYTIEIIITLLLLLQRSYCSLLTKQPTIIAQSTIDISLINAPPGFGFDLKEVGWTLTFSSLSIESLSRHSSPSLPLGMRPRLWLQSSVSSTRFSYTVESYPSDSPATTLDKHSHSPSHSAGPSRKMYMSPATTVPSSIHASRALVPTHVNLLPPHKRFKDSISSEDSIEEDINADVLANIEADVMAIKVTSDMDVEAGVDAGIGIEIKDDIEDKDEGEAEHFMEIPLQRVEDIETGQRQLEAKGLIASGGRDGLLDHVAALEKSNTKLQDTLRMESVRADRLRRRMGFMEDELRHIHRFCYYNRLRFRRLEAFVIMTITRSSMTPKEITELINQRVAEALAIYEATRAVELVVESQSQNGDDGDNENSGGNRNGNGKGNGDGNGGANGNGNG